MNYLLLRLYGPMASWGDIAIGESRHSHPGPTKAAVMGLVAAALGIERDEEAQHLALNRGYRMATALFGQGQLLRDYHTVQAPDSVGKFRYRTRRDELRIGRDRLGTVLSSREYRTDALAWVALQPLADAPRPLDELAAALKEPVFIPYLGRKACPLAAPMQPEEVSAEGFLEAFRRYAPGGLSVRLQGAVLDGTTLPFVDDEMTYCWEGPLDSFAAAETLDRSCLRTEVFHDQLLSRKRWQFAPRHVHLYRSREGVECTCLE